MATNLSHLEIEPEAQEREVERLTKGRNSFETIMAKEGVPFDESLNWLLERGYQRHLRPAEAFSLLIESIENNTPPKLTEFEWVSCALAVHRDHLYIYFEPHGLKFFEIVVPMPDAGYLYTYYGGDISAAESYRVHVPNLHLFLKDPEFEGSRSSMEDRIQWNERTKIKFDLFPDEVVQLLTGRKFKELPETIRNGFVIPDPDYPVKRHFGELQIRQWDGLITPLYLNPKRYSFGTYRGAKVTSRGVKVKKDL